MSRPPFVKCVDKARTWLGMVRNKMLFRRYRRLGKILQRKGIIPANRPGLR